MLRAKLERLGVRRLLLAIQDVSFPCDPDEDLGRGTPASAASERLFAFAREHGFTGIQLGPQGQTARSNPSPYDGTLFSRHLGTIAPSTWRALVGDDAVDRHLVAGRRADHAHAHDASHALLALAYTHVGDVRARLDDFKREHAAWLVPDALHATLCDAQGGAGYRDWPPAMRDLWLGEPDLHELVALHETAIDRYALGQLLAHDEHVRVRERAAGLSLYGDLQIGFSDADAWRWQAALLSDYHMGAPPSRTNPEGQPWGYPVLDPDQYDGAVQRLMVARVARMRAEYDGLRIDHPHGIVCPWVYRRDTGDPEQAVRDGARLFESPDLTDHPALARHALVRPDQIDHRLSRFANHWVKSLEPAQIESYARLFDLVVAGHPEISCEVLSTMPVPLGAMLERHGLGRWRVTQKASPTDPTDVYRTENAAPADWVMLGNHDTPAILTVIATWSSALREQWCRHLAARLHLADPAGLADDRFVATCMLAELFLSPAENVSIFFVDLFGYTERYNIPGVIDPANWTLRLEARFEERRGLDLPLAVDLALAARTA